MTVYSMNNQPAADEASGLYRLLAVIAFIFTLSTYAKMAETPL